MKIIFVCSGNTCRSPMAEYICREKLTEMGRQDIDVCSRGLSVMGGGSIAPNSLAVLKSMGIDGSAHIPTQLTDEEIESTDYVLTMTRSLASAIKRVCPSEKVMSLGDAVGGGDVSDPYGGDMSVYSACGGQIAILIDKLVPLLIDIANKSNRDSSNAE